MPLPHPHRGRLWKSTFASLALPFALMLSFSSAQAQAPAPPAAPSMWKDLRVLPKEISKPELKSIMKTMSKSLGVDCDLCHKEPNMEADTPNKKIAREMMQMTAELNKKYRPTTNGKVTCFTCHRGDKRPAEAPK